MGRKTLNELRTGKGRRGGLEMLIQCTELKNKRRRTTEAPTVPRNRKGQIFQGEGKG